MHTLGPHFPNVLERKIWGALLSLMVSRDQVGRVWDNWLSERLKRHSKTDARIELRVVRLAAGIVLWTMGAHATMRVVQKKVSVSRALAGHVAVLGTEAPASGVSVGLCSPDWKKIIATTKTDDEGHFSLEKLANTRLFYLRVSAPGMDTYQLRVRIEKHAAEELKIHLSVAT